MSGTQLKFGFKHQCVLISKLWWQATVLIETLPAAFEMHEILWELREHSAGLNCGRWDYIFSFIKTLREHPDSIMPDRHAAYRLLGYACICYANFGHEQEDVRQASGQVDCEELGATLGYCMLPFLVIKGTECDSRHLLPVSSSTLKGSSASVASNSPLPSFASPEGMSSDFLSSQYKTFRCSKRYGVQGRGDDDAAVHAGVQPAADQDVPPARRARDGRHGSPDPHQGRPGRQQRSPDQGPPFLDHTGPLLV